MGVQGKIIFTTALFLSILAAKAQSTERDSLINIVNNTPGDTFKVLNFARLSRLYLYEKPVTGISYSIQGLDLARKLKYKRGVAICLNEMGNCYRMTGNYTKALALHFEALKIAEELKDNETLANSYHGISAVHEDQGYYNDAVNYAHKVIYHATLAKNDFILMRIQSNMGVSFQEMKMLDSGYHYLQNAYEISIRLKDLSLAGNIHGRLGNIHYLMGNDEMALAFYKKGASIAENRKDNNSLSEIYVSIGAYYQDRKQYDSSNFYSRKGLETGILMNNPNSIIRSSLILSKNFRAINNTDSAFKYQEIAINTKDTIITVEKLKQSELLLMDERDRQRENAEREKKQEEARKKDIEFLFSGIAVITIFIIFLILSRSIIVNSRTIIYFGIIALLLSFEFINLLIHPFLESVTNHSPALMLLSLVIIAAILVPLHHKLVSWVTHQVVEKNRRIRLSAAKKIIASLESETTDKSLNK